MERVMTKNTGAPAPDMYASMRTLRGESAGDMPIPAEVFGCPRNTDLILQAVRILRANRRVGTAHTKNRGEVRGGGRKPWRQKGTGNARHGSRRSPIWAGGGVTFGPRSERSYALALPKKMRRRALLCVLSAKFRAGSLLFVDALQLDRPKTKDVAAIANVLGCGEMRTLFVLPDLDPAFVAAASNLPNVRTIRARDINVLDLLSARKVVIPADAVPVIASTFLRDTTKGSDA